MKQKKVLPVIAMLLIVLASGCQKDEDIGLSPSVIAADPINSEVSGVGLIISTTFGVAMNPSTITTSHWRWHII